jgi:paraquat-inducible protein A
MIKKPDFPVTLSCRTCEAPVLDRDLDPGDELRCARCAELIKSGRRSSSLQPAWALSSTGIVLAVLANVYPVMTFDVLGYKQATLIITGVLGLASQDFRFVAFVVFFCAIAAPVLYFCAVWYVSAACCLGRHLPLVEGFAKAAERLAPWSLVPVFAVACFVAVVKLDMLGTVTWQPGIFWVILLSICCITMSRVFDQDTVEENLETLR